MPCEAPFSADPAGAPRLTIGLAVYDDFDGLYFTIQALRLFHAEVIRQCEILVVDNHPHGPDGQATREFVERWVRGDVEAARYVAEPSVVGTTFSRERVFREAAAPAVLCIDSHVLIAPGAVRQLLEYYEAHPDTRDLLSGPLVYDDLRNVSTHMQDEWRGGMWGTWGTDARGTDPTAEPFAIPAMGLGLFSCLKAAWPGFNPQFRGFGGEEWYLHTKFRQAGGRCLCLPFLRWVHRFARPRGVPYPLDNRDRIRNYILGHCELGLPLERVREHFVGGGMMSDAEWRQLADAAVPSETPSDEGCVSCPPPLEPGPLEALYERAWRTPGDINEHCPLLRQLAAGCNHVTEFGVRRGVSTTALLAGRPRTLVCYDLERSDEVDLLASAAGSTAFRFIQHDSLTAQIEPTDLLFIDTRHSAEQLSGELQRHASKVGRWIVLHDTATFGEVGEDGGPGLLPALRSFLQAHPDWSVMEQRTNNNGLTVLTRDPLYKRALPTTIVSAAHLAASVARRIAGGLARASPAERARRLEICALCDRRIDGRCAECGCAIADKAAWRSSRCPLGKWPAVSQGGSNGVP